MLNELSKTIVVSEMLESFTVITPKGKHISLNDRKSYGLSICVEGQITYTHRGKTFLCDPEHAVMLPEAQSYEFVGDKHTVTRLINFKCAEPICDTLIEIPVENPMSLLSDFDKLRTLGFFEGNRLQRISIFCGMLHRMIAPTSSAALLPAIKYIEENCHDPELNNETLATLCHVSEVYLRRLFVKQYNTTPRQFIIDARMNKAKQLLSEGNKKITAIAEQCGFSNTYHFCRTFKRLTGLTPTEYMLANKVIQL